MNLPEALKRIRRMLESKAPGAVTALDELSEESSDPFRVLISTILSHRTRDANTTRASRRLFSVYATPQSLAEANPEEIERLIKPVGFYRVKSRTIREVAAVLLDRFGGRVPERMEDLLSLPSVGRKTANCVLVYGFGQPAIPVDTHVHRIMNRLGFVSTKKPEETESQLTNMLDRRYWLELNDLLVRFGQEICKPIGPRCPECDLRKHCPYGRARISGTEGSATR